MAVNEPLRPRDSGLFTILIVGIDLMAFSERRECDLESISMIRQIKTFYAFQLNNKQ